MNFLIYAIDTTSNDQTLEILSPFVVSAEIEKDIIFVNLKRILLTMQLRQYRIKA